MLARVLKTISRYNMLPPGARVIVAVSGGADSVCLFHVLKELFPDAVSGVAHFNHKWRAEASDEDEHFVAEMTRPLPFFRAEGVPAAGNKEQNARRARLAFFETLGATVALGHTRDDQAETVLFRFLRGSGLAGLSGIAPTADGIIRPLLEITRAEVEQYLRARNIPWREDATNRDMHFARNRIRHELLPQLARDWNPKITDALANLADLAHEEERYWQSALNSIKLIETPGAIELRASLLGVLDAPRCTDRDETQFGSDGLVGPPMLAAAALSGGFFVDHRKPAERQAATKIGGPTKVASQDVFESGDARPLPLSMPPPLLSGLGNGVYFPNPAVMEGMLTRVASVGHDRRTSRS
jgi:tRNA(Ile)-lysidine synthetase-like protein